MLHIEIDHASAEPAYRQISRQLRKLIFDGLLPAGSRLPSMRALSAQLGVSLNTIHAALDGLSAENLIVTRQGGGTYINEHVAAATGANLRTREDYANELSGLPRMRWDAYAFEHDYFLYPPARVQQESISFIQASPDPALYPFERIKQIVTNMLWQPKELLFDRGHPQGYLPLIEYLEREMALSGVPMAEGENDIILTSGFLRALSVILRLVLRPGEKVAIESPTYSSIINLLLAERIGIEPIPMDEEGMDTAYLETVLARGEVRAVITIPTFHNPTGITMSHRRRLKLLQLAAEHQLPVIEDDWGRLIRYSGTAPAPLKALDPGDYVIHIGNFSKVFLPGLRIGWITCASELALTLVHAKLASDQADSFFLQAFVHEFISRGHFGRHVRSSIAEYRKRRDVMAEALEQHLPPECSFRLPAGGLSIWLELPPAIMSLPLLKVAREAGVEFLPAAYCMPDRQDAPALRLAFSRSSQQEIEQGVRTLCQVITDCIRDPRLLEDSGTRLGELK